MISSQTHQTPFLCHSGLPMGGTPPACPNTEPTRNSLLSEGEKAIGNRRVFTGMGFGPEGVPIDIATILLAAAEAQHCTVLVTDTFLIMNGMPPAQSELLTQKLERSVLSLTRLFHLPVTTMRSSEFMTSPDYLQVFAITKDIVRQQGLERHLQETVPPKYRTRPEALLYPLHEVACSLFLEARGYQTKLGPRSEKAYDQSIQAVGGDLLFAYAIDALPVSTSKPTPVNHYIPSHRARGSRIFFDTPDVAIATHLQASTTETLRYLCLLGSEAGRLLWQTVSHGSGNHFDAAASSSGDSVLPSQ